MTLWSKSMFRIWLLVGFVGVALALGFALGQSWYLIALIGLMMGMHLFGHGGHGGDSHAGSQEDGSGDEGHHHGS